MARGTSRWRNCSSWYAIIWLSNPRRAVGGEHRDACDSGHFGYREGLPRAGRHGQLHAERAGRSGTSRPESYTPMAHSGS